MSAEVVNRDHASIQVCQKYVDKMKYDSFIVMFIQKYQVHFGLS